MLNVDVGQTIIAALLVGAIPLTASWFLIKRINRKLEVAVPGSQTDTAALDRPESELPSFTLSILPVVLPILLISAASTAAAFKSFRVDSPTAFAVIEFLGNRNVALIIGAVLAMLVVMRQRGMSFAKINEHIGPPFETAGVIILITSAGGAFGYMLINARVGDAIRASAAGHEMNLILFAWLIASVIRIAQGSTTIALLTTSAMVQPIIASSGTLALSPHLHLPGHRLRRDDPVLDERQRLLGHRPPLRLHRAPDPPHLDRPAHLQLDRRPPGRPRSSRSSCR